ncbi:hypothetical protein [Rudanella lutea]|uniref:hypothetical protein n=1 Tax=Rudanella lutea TaxID=451374 RepID=UPI001FE09DDA|nr:hypothetical protein [Rudanella lutea]
MFALMRSLGNVEGTAYNRFMKGATFMIPSPRLLTQVVDLLSDVRMEDRVRRVMCMNTCSLKSRRLGKMGSFIPLDTSSN